MPALRPRPTPLLSRLATRVGLLMCLPALLVAGSARAGASPEAIRQLLDSYAQNRQFNGVVLVARDGDVLQRVAYGQADHDWDTPNTTDTRFRIGSLTKPFTATLVMQLVQEGRLRLEGRLGDYLPDLYGDTPAADITLAQLLSHTSGLRDTPGNYDDPWWRTEARRAYAPDAFARAWIPATLEGPPGRAFRYINNGYFLLGLIIERVTGQRYEVNLAERILTPAGMGSSGLYQADARVPRLARGYETRADGQRIPARYIDPSVSYAAAGLYATVDDLYRFDRALRSDRLLGAPARKAMWTARQQGYGYGWNIESWPLAEGGRAEVMLHTGSVPGYQSVLLRSEHGQAFVVILDNDWRGELVMTMGKDLMEVLLGKPVTLAKKSLADRLVPIALAQGNPAMVAAYANLGDERRDYDTGERALNALGYRLLRLQRSAEAISVFEWNVKAHPESSNVHDSLGEAYRAAGRTADAVASYRRSLARDPGNANAAKALRELGAP